MSRTARRCFSTATRWQRGQRPFTVMSCDNLQDNGYLSKRVFTAFARLRDPELGDWVERETRFPNSMVDRITRVTTDANRAEVRERFGIEDRWPVVCEPYTQWVLKDAFTVGRPPYEQVGVQVVDHVEPYELMKLRLLNGSHQALAYFGYLCGYRLVHEAAQDPLFQSFLLGYMDKEATPTLAPVPGVDLQFHIENQVPAEVATRGNFLGLCRCDAIGFDAHGRAPTHGQNQQDKQATFNRAGHRESPRSYCRVHYHIEVTEFYVYARFTEAYTATRARWKNGSAAAPTSVNVVPLMNIDSLEMTDKDRVEQYAALLKVDWDLKN